MYDKLFETKVNRAKQLAQKIEGTKLHRINEKLQEERSAKLNYFSQLYECGGSLLEKKTNLRLDQAPLKKQLE